jgi:hypothetical protein
VPLPLLQALSRWLPADVGPVTPTVSGSRVLLLLLALGAISGLIASRRGRASSSLPPSTATRRLRAAYWLVACLGAGLRALLAFRLAPYHYEINDITIHLGLLERLVSNEASPWDLLHPPLHALLMGAWGIVLDGLRRGLELGWLRLSNLPLWFLLAAAVWRAGRTLRQPWAALGVLTILAFLPRSLELSVYRYDYFLQLVTVTVFLERLLAHAQDRGESTPPQPQGWRRFAPSPLLSGVVLWGAAALWSGYLCALVVIPGGLVALGLSWRRGARRAVGVALIAAAALGAPLAERALEGAQIYVTASAPAGSRVEDASGPDEGSATRQGHAPMVLPGAAGPRALLSFPAWAAATTCGHTLPLRSATRTLLALLGLGWALALWRRPGLALTGGLILVTFAMASGVLALHDYNLSPLAPVWFGVPTLGVVLGGGRRAPWLGGLLAALVITLSLSERGFEPQRAPGGPWPWLMGEHTSSALAARLDPEAELRGRPLLALDDAFPHVYRVCRGAGERAEARHPEGAMAAYARCEQDIARERADDRLFSHTTLGGRPLALSGRAVWDALGPGRCDPIDALLTEAPWRDHRHLVLINDDFLATMEEEATCLEVSARLTAGCTLDLETADRRLYRCDARR